MDSWKITNAGDGTGILDTGSECASELLRSELSRQYLLASDEAGMARATGVGLARFDLGRHATTRGASVQRLRDDGQESF